MLRLLLLLCGISLLLLAGPSSPAGCDALAPQPSSVSLLVTTSRATRPFAIVATAAAQPGDNRASNKDNNPHEDRRTALSSLFLQGTAVAGALLATTSSPLVDAAGAADSIETPSFVQEYSDFTKTPEGWSYREVTPGKAGATKAATGDKVVFDWSGFTIGYFGRPFQAKGGPQGGAFDKDIDYSRTVLGSGTMVKGLECAMVDMSQGQVRQVVVPYGELSYPPNDPNHDRVGPKPTTFSGMRALNFVLDNPRLDRTMLFNVKVIRVDKPDGKGGFIRG